MRRLAFAAPLAGLLVALAALADQASVPGQNGVTLQAGHLVTLAAVALFLSQIGVVAWVKWSFGKVAEDAARASSGKARDEVIEMLEDHMTDRFAHPEAMERSLADVNGKLARLADDIASVKEGVLALVSDHIVGLKRRATDPESVDSSAIARMRGRS